MHICGYICCGCLTIAFMIGTRLFDDIVMRVIRYVLYLFVWICVIVVGCLVNGSSRTRPLTCGKGEELKTI